MTGWTPEDIRQTAALNARLAKAEMDRHIKREIRRMTRQQRASRRRLARLRRSLRH